MNLGNMSKNTTQHKILSREDGDLAIPISSAHFTVESFFEVNNLFKINFMLLIDPICMHTPYFIFENKITHIYIHTRWSMSM